MNPLLVTAFFDIGRGSWRHLARSPATYVERFRSFGARLEAPRFLFASSDVAAEVGHLCQHVEVVSLTEMPAYRYLARTRDVMASAEFRRRFRAKDDARHCEHLYPEYNVAMLAKFDALRHAAQTTRYRHSHYIWLDFGASHRSTIAGDASLPAVSPRARSEVVLIGTGRRRLWRIRRKSLARYITSFRVRAVGNLMIVPADRVEAFCDAVVAGYELLLDMNLTTDDQPLLDIAMIRHPQMFYLARAPRGVSPFEFGDEVLAGRA
jgi:hypothetical protein